MLPRRHIRSSEREAWTIAVRRCLFMVVPHHICLPQNVSSVVLRYEHTSCMVHMPQVFRRLLAGETVQIPDESAGPHGGRHISVDGRHHRGGASRRCTTRHVRQDLVRPRPSLRRGLSDLTGHSWLLVVHIPHCRPSNTFGITGVHSISS